MTITAGTRLGAYEILAPIGSGGMGEVYRARDNKLKRDVALKVLPEAFANDTERMARFQREAEVLASLNHPNIAQIYGVEGPALIMELVEGETLQGPLPPETALNYARQIADALQAAHEKGIVHRDLKPANVKVSSQGVIKVLDFGLAKASEEVPGDLQNSPTRTISPTRAGMILGTAAYMSPEQARGKPVDRRADIWAFGAVLYEMLTGRELFAGESIPDILAAVLTREPDWGRVPDAFRPLLQRCLEKDPGKRLRDLGDLDLLFPKPARELAPRRQRDILAWAALSAAAAALAVFLWMRPSSPPAESATRFVIPMSANEELTDAPAISPDGRLVAYTAQKGGGDPHLYLRDLGAFEAREVTGSGGASQPFFSFDGKWLAFFAQGQLQKVAVSGGAPIKIAAATFPFGGTFLEDGSILYVRDEVSGLMLLRSGAGQPEALTKPDGRDNGFSHTWPQALPGGEYVLFTLNARKNRGIAALSLKTRRWQLVLPGVSGGVVAAGAGPIVRLFVSDPSAGIKVALLNAARPAPTTADTTVLENVTYLSGASSLRTGLAVSASGSAVYIPGDPGKRLLAWVDRTGRAATAVAAPAAFLQMVLSPDGTKVVALIDADLWVYELATGTRHRLTFYGEGGSSASSPMWSADGSRIIYAANESGDHDMYSQPADGSRAAELILKRPFNQYPTSMTRDGTLLFGEGYPDHGEDLFTLSSDGKVTPVRITPSFSEVNGQFSPDGQRLAYQSDESGRNEIYVEDYPGGGHRAVASTDGGTIPMWSRDGKELFYVAGDAVIVAAVGSDGSIGQRRKLFDRSPYSFFWHSYDPAPDGKRLLMIRRDAASVPRQLNVILNWSGELQRLLPVGGK